MRERERETNNKEKVAVLECLGYRAAAPGLLHSESRESKTDGVSSSFTVKVKAEMCQWVCRDQSRGSEGGRHKDEKAQDVGNT